MPPRISFLVLTLSALLGAVLHAAPRPNFLLIIADDATWSDFGFSGNKDVKTPHLDDLRSQGMFLDHMFDAATTCSPTRHAIYTGLHCIRSGAYPNHTRVYDGTKSIFTYLKDAGYRVALQNKSHVGPRSSFPYEPIPGADDLTKTRAFLTRSGDQPWFLAYCSNDPHAPWTRGSEKYDPDKITIPPYLHDNPTTRQLRAKYYSEITQLDTQVGNLMKLLDETRQADNTVVIFVSEQGSSIPYGGKWLLYDNGIRAASLVRWPGRVKPASSCQALVAYTDITPTLLEAAGINPSTIDTGCPDATGSRGFDGRSFLKLLTGKADKLHDIVFAQHTTVGIIGYKQPYPMRCARDSRYKYIRNLAPQNTYTISGIHRGEPLASWKADAQNDPQLAKRVAWLYHRPANELYDLDNDPYEMHNLADTPEVAAIQKKLSTALDAWMSQQGDKGMKTEMLAKSRQGSAGKGTRKKKGSPPAAKGRNPRARKEP